MFSCVNFQEPLKQAAKKLKKLKSGGDQKSKKESGKNFDALPDETTGRVIYIYIYNKRGQLKRIASSKINIC